MTSQDIFLFLSWDEEKSRAEKNTSVNKTKELNETREFQAETQINIDQEVPRKSYKSENAWTSARSHSQVSFLKESTSNSFFFKQWKFWNADEVAAEARAQKHLKDRQRTLLQHCWITKERGNCFLNLNTPLKLQEWLPADKNTDPHRVLVMLIKGFFNLFLTTETLFFFYMQYSLKHGWSPKIMKTWS